MTVSGMIIAAGATGGPVISSAYPEWIAEYMLEQNNGYYPLPVSMSSMLAYLFPATVQAYWDEVLEHAFAANQKALNAIPTPFVAPIMFVLDLVSSHQGAQEGRLRIGGVQEQVPLAHGVQQAPA